MRITGGIAKGIHLTVPKKDVRPAMDSIREAVFSSLSNLVEVPGPFIDLFAGSGAYGLEYLSRYEQGGIFAENSAQTISFIKENLANVIKSMGNHDPKIIITKTDAFKYEFEEKNAGIIFMDPPYPTFDKIFSSGLWERAGIAAEIIVLEMPSEVEPPEHDDLILVKHISKKGKNKPSVGIYKQK
jgi:16S rRNA (guanine966-N2)-methyltransferase